MPAVVRLYMQPPDNAVVSSVEEKTSIQALNRTQPPLPMKPHQIERLSHEYKRGQSILRNDSDTFIRFLRGLLPRIIPASTCT